MRVNNCGNRRSRCQRCWLIQCEPKARKGVRRRKVENGDESEQHLPPAAMLCRGHGGEVVGLGLPGFAGGPSVGAKDFPGGAMSLEIWQERVPSPVTAGWPPSRPGGNQDMSSNANARICVDRSGVTLECRHLGLVVERICELRTTRQLRTCTSRLAKQISPTPRKKTQNRTQEEEFR